MFLACAVATVSNAELHQNICGVKAIIYPVTSKCDRLKDESKYPRLVVYYFGADSVQVPEANFRSGTKADKIASLKVLKREKLAVLVVAMWQIYANKKGAAF